MEIKNGIKSLDALHLSCAINAKADYFITVDDGILWRKENLFSGMTVEEISRETMKLYNQLNAKAENNV
ncbi:MAG: hypothetical protein LBR47_03555 [Spirochaetaceae bacterium]|jgi:predicted nucleic acid-binding protein|nr:hypothetical protein [Spirochaetaceae bacterium]